MTDAKLFLGPGDHLIVPTLRSYGGNIVQRKVKWGWWYTTYPFKLIRKATYLEIYIMSNYTMCGSKNE